jgi:hypothetical protein
MKELVVRSLYVEMLGQDASFAYIRAVELCASTSITQKRVGYLAGNLISFLCYLAHHDIYHYSILILIPYARVQVHVGQSDPARHEKVTMLLLCRCIFPCSPFSPLVAQIYWK